MAPATQAGACSSGGVFAQGGPYRRGVVHGGPGNRHVGVGVVYDDLHRLRQEFHAPHRVGSPVQGLLLDNARRDHGT